MYSVLCNSGVSVGSGGKGDDLIEILLAGRVDEERRLFDDVAGGLFSTLLESNKEFNIIPLHYLHAVICVFLVSDTVLATLEKQGTNTLS